MQNMISNKPVEVNPIFEALVTCKTMVKYILVFGFILNLLALASPLFSMQVLDRVLSSGNKDTLLFLTLVITVALSLQSLIQGARAFASNRLGIWFESKLGETVFVNAIKSAKKSRAMANSQQLRDLQTIKTYLTSPGLITMMDVPWAIIFLIVLFVLHKYIGFLALIGGSIIVVVGFIGDKSTKKLLEANNENFIASMRNVDQVTRNAEVVEVMGFTRNVINSWQKFNQKVQVMQSLTNERQAFFMELIKFIRVMLQISVTGLGALLVLHGEFSAGGIIASSSLVARALAPFESAINSWKGYINAKKSYDRLKEAFKHNERDEEKTSLPAPEGKIEVENLYYAYPGSNKHFIKGVTFQINPGESVAIIGPSGSGKTTLSKLIVGAADPTIGVVRIDGASIKDWRKDELGPYIGYLPQGVELFSGTARENIARMDPNGDSEKVIVAAQLAGVHDLILQLPKGYDTELGVDGSMLSGGQRQRIGLARCFYGEPKILVLDEPNANLDDQGEKALETALAVAKEQNITTVIVSHKNSILKFVDKLMVMKDGMLVAFGPTQEILSKLNSPSGGATPGEIVSKK